MESKALLNAKLKEYAQIKNEAKKVIKLEFPKETWRALGIVTIINQISYLSLICV